MFVFRDVLVPVRCFSCGKMIADKFDTFRNDVKAGKNPQKVLDELGLERYCCRRMLLTTVESIQQIIPFYEAMHKRNQEVQSELE